jgi:AcrR family transcriptional regulator
MPGATGKGGQLDQRSRKELFRLLSLQAPAPASAWQAFWKPVLRHVNGAEVRDEDMLAAAFEDGLNLISSRGLASEQVAARWVKEVVAQAEHLGIERGGLLKRLLAEMVSRQTGPREHGRTQTPQARKKILAAALEVFSCKGFHGATVDEIADRAGLGKGTVYRHFNSKRELFSELINSKVAELEETVTGAIDTQGDVLDIIETYLRIYFAFFDRNRDLYKVLIQEQSDFGAEVKALYIGNILKRLPLLKLKIYQATKSGRLKQMNFHTVFYGVMGFIDGVIQKWLASEGKYSLVEEVPTVLETLFYGFVSTNASGRSVGSKPA